MSEGFDSRAFQAKLERLEVLLREVERFNDPAARAYTREIVQAVLELHGTALERLLECMAETGESGAALLDTCADDTVVSGLLLLHGLHPMSLEQRVLQALDKVRPFLGSHGGDVELVGIDEGLVRLRLQGSCHSCPSSTVTMQHTVEEAIYARAPEVTAIEVEGVAEEQQPVTDGAARLALPLV